MDEIPLAEKGRIIYLRKFLISFPVFWKNKIIFSEVKHLSSLKIVYNSWLISNGEWI